MKRVQVMTETISRIFKAFHGDAKIYFFKVGFLKMGAHSGQKSSKNVLFFHIKNRKKWTNILIFEIACFARKVQK